MAKKRTRYYIRVLGHGKAEEYVEIDLSRNSQASLTELYVRVEGKDGVRYSIVPGGEAMLNQDVDLSCVHSAVSQITEQTADVISTFGDDARGVFGVSIGDITVAFYESLRLASMGQVQQAAGVAQDLFWDFHSLVMRAGALIDGLSDTTDGLAQSHAMLSNTMDLDQRSDSMYETWALVCASFLEDVVCVQTIEDEISQSLSLGRNFAESWLKQCVSFGPRFEEIVLFLEDVDGEGRDCFWMRAFSYLHGSGCDTSLNDVKQDVEKACSLVAWCERLLSDVRVQWTEELQRLQECTARYVSRIDEVCDRLVVARKKFFHFRDVVFKGCQPVYEIHEDIVSRSQYDLIQTMLRDPEWMIDRLRKRLYRRCHSLVRELGEEPVLPERLSSVLRDVRDMINSVHEKVRFDSQEAGTSACRDWSGVALVDVGKLDVSATPHDEDVPEELAREIEDYAYDLIIIAAASVMNLNTIPNFVGIDRLLRIAFSLGDLFKSFDKIEFYRKYLFERIVSDEECVRVDTFDEVQEAWEWTKKTWTLFVASPDPVNQLRLSKLGAERAARLRLEYGYSVEAVSQACQACVD